MSAARRWQMLFVQSLTIGRIPLIFVFLGVSVFAPHPPSAMWFSIAFTAMILSAVTDLFDGYLARKFKVATQLGAYVDPLTDKIFYLTTFPTLIFLAARANEIVHAQLLLGLTILFLLRDQWVSFLRSIGALYKVDAKANWSGKARTLISFPVICTFYYAIEAPQHWRLQVHDMVIYVMVIASMIINLISIWVYSVYYWPCLKKELRVPAGPSGDGQDDGD